MNFIYTLPSYKCDKKCPYCITKILKRKPKSDNIEDIIKIIESLEHDKYEFFILSGNGEPSLYSYEDLKLIRDCVEKSGKFKNFRVQTSGNLFLEKEKLSLGVSWWKEITICSIDKEEDKSFYKYKKHYLKETLNKDYIRCNYVVLKDNVRMLSETLEVLVGTYPWVAIKILDSHNKFIEEFAVGYEVVPTIVEELNSTSYIKDPAIYNLCEGHYEWETKNGAKLTMSYGKKKGHDRIFIEEVTYV